jgi:hypothetical protein
MASIRKRNEKWQVQIRRAGHRPISKTFILRKDALQWARDAERQADRGDLPKDPKVLRQLTLGDLVRRYRDSVSLHKAGYQNECIVFNAFLKHPICCKALAEVRTEDFAEYRDERLKTVKSTTLKRQLNRPPTGGDSLVDSAEGILRYAVFTAARCRYLAIVTMRNIYIVD